jgi:hypothetical protein
LSGGNASEIAKIDEDIEQVEALIASAQDALAITKRNAETRTRIETLGAEQKRLAGELERAEKELNLIEKFVRAKCSALTDRINSKFEIVRWKLFEVQMNGGIAECCVALVDGVPFDGGLNHASCINAGLDVARTFQDFFDFHPPVWIDEQQSCNHPLPMNCQVIRLRASSDETFRIELDDEDDSSQRALL